MTEFSTEEKVWFYAKPDGSKYGPYTEDELIKLLKNGILDEKDYIWMMDFENWMKVADSIYSFYLGMEQPILGQES
ncbi:MAG: DUF4339 domain-containing protein [Solobacterium sp.]|nr:DUF4339 domain-containing protein [Solobacterium sp.]MBR2793378.1 DUF4339 domain-containing protein [Solobacterium sp.]